MQDYNEESDERYFPEHVQYFQKLHELHNDLPFLPERMRIEKIEKLVAHLNDKTKYVIHITYLKLIKQWIDFEKTHRVIKLNQSGWLKPYIDMNTDLRKNDFEKDFIQVNE